MNSYIKKFNIEFNIESLNSYHLIRTYRSVISSHNYPLLEMID